MQIGNSLPLGTAGHAPPPSPGYLSSREGELALVVIGLGVAVIAALCVALFRKEASPEEAIRGYAIVLIIVGTMLLICAGYSNDQIAPAMGLFGTIAGYLLGRKGSQ